MALTAEQERKLERIKNYPTRYEVTMTNGAEKYLVVYMASRSFTRLKVAVGERLDAIKAITKEDVFIENRKIVAGSWRIDFSKRTQREAIMEGELPFINRVVEQATAA